MCDKRTSAAVTVDGELYPGHSSGVGRPRLFRTVTCPPCTHPCTQVVFLSDVVVLFAREEEEQVGDSPGYSAEVQMAPAVLEQVGQEALTPDIYRRQSRTSRRSWLYGM